MQRKDKMAILKKDTIKKQVIDLTGPQGNAFYLLGVAMKLSKDIGLDLDAVLEDLKGGDAADNAKAMEAMLDGEPGAFRDIVIYTAAAALIVADKAEDLKEGAEMAAKAIDEGNSRKALERMVSITNA